MVIDMHRGIIQQGNWTRPKSYLRGVIDKWEIHKNIQKGRIYRLVHDSYKPDVQPRLLDKSTAELVPYLNHPNGWWRDTAQKLIILRKDRESVVPKLENLVVSRGSELDRLHSLWTLEGIGKVNPRVLIAALNDGSSLVRSAAVRVAEPFLADGNVEVIKALTTSEHVANDIEMALQAINSVGVSNPEHPVLAALVDGLLDKYSDNEAIQAVKSLQGSAIAARAEARAQERRGKAYASAMEKGKVIYQQLCFSCHGADGKGTPMPGQKGHFLAPSFVNNPRLSGGDVTAIRTLLHGLTGDIDGKKYEGLMVSMATNDDQWIADITTYIRNSFGNKYGLSQPHTVAALRKKHASRKTPWTQAELEELAPPVLANRKSWKLTASHNAGDLKNAIDGDPKSRYSTSTSMKKGMWVQVEFPKLSKITTITLDTRSSDGDYPRGYEVQVSKDGKKWSKPVAKGKGTTPLTQIKIDPTEAKFMRITQTGKHRLFWSIHELSINGKEF